MSAEVSAQEGGSIDPPDPVKENHKSDSHKSDSEGTLGLESEIRTNKPAVVIPATKETKEVQRDSSQVKMLKPIKPSEKARKTEDPLSFNFLYYIIEKFKLSDMIE